jgi:hypothetical protein
MGIACWNNAAIIEHSHRIAWLGICSRVKSGFSSATHLSFQYITLRIGVFPILTSSSPQPDSESSVCDEPTCTRHFTYFTRRHHCRRCGNIFCDLHSLYNIPLDQDANYHPQGTRSRACEHCWFEYCSWQVARHTRSNSDSSHDEPRTPTTPIVSCNGRSAMGSVFGQKEPGAPASLGASVPRDWNWSTF